MNQFPSVSLLITHYNRSRSLHNLLNAFSNLNCTFGEIIVSDDGSRPEHIEYIRQLQEQFNFRCVTSERNRGLGNNLNKGQDVVSKLYTLYVQEDFIPMPLFIERLGMALHHMERDQKIDLVRFYSYIPFPYSRPYDEHFSKLLFKSFGIKYNKLHMYSDHPHLRRSNFFEKFGRYKEGIKGDVTEYNMCLSVIQNKGEVLFHRDYRALFKQVNTSDEPSTMIRNKLRYSNFFLLKWGRDLFRQIKFNYDIHFKRLKKNRS
ncbi:MULTISPECIES: glycosyltransferase family 2 protein [Olivibacter]|jgi:glycosyltransferase involved in cell wall biosynthesis|uniref:Glycosyltransferase family 2 protein n=1 Tax=Olivibacter oleidegradans TaxID=760123 RepID=A0ABV6HQH3_9SPHI|nr:MULTISPECIES: glycosyltransferase family 2 protein [Olivibacter]MDX3915430.1 glycosyltransferase family 2 protein [Pseudosphingobacterium sp.]QEL02925.1 glycosyltransferase family 2 protein [Olivibacter sp. LS-1]